MRHEAERTDAAFTKLGLTMDGLGSRKRAQGIERSTRAVRSLGLEAEQAGRRTQRYERDVRRADAATGGWGNRLRTVGRGLKDFAGEVAGLARVILMPLGMGAALGVAGQAVGALAGGVVALAPRLADMTGLLAPLATGVLGLGVAFVSASTAFKQLQTAFKGGPAGFQALKMIGPAGRGVVFQLRMMRGEVRQLEQAGSRPMFTGLLSGIKDFRRVAPALEPMLRRFGNVTGGLFATAGRRLTSPGALRDLNNITGQGAHIEKQAGLGALNLLDALRNLLVVAKPFTTWLSNTVFHWTQLLAQFTKTGRESGRLQQFFSRTQKATAGLFHGVRDLWIIFRNLGRAARPAGEILYRSMSKTLDAWVQITSTPEKRAQLIQDFDHMAVAIKSMARLAGALGLAIFNMGSSGNLQQTADALTRAVGPAQKILSGLANTFGPPAAKTIADFGTLLSNLGGANGPLVTALKLVDNIIRGLNFIISKSGGGGGAAGSVLGGLLAARLLSKTGLLSFGLGGVGRGTRLGGGRANAAVAALPGAGLAEGLALGGLGRSVLGGRGRRTLVRGVGGEAIVGAEGSLGRMAAGGMLLRGGLAAAARFVAPIMALQALWGGLTAGGGVGNRIYGASNAALFGIPGLLTGGMGGQKSAVAQDQAGLAAEMTGVERGSRGMDRLNQQVVVLRQHIAQFADDTSAQGASYRSQLEQELAARRQLIGQLRAEAQQRGQARGSDIVGSLNQLYQKLLRGGAGKQAALQGAVASGLQQLGRYPGAGAQATATRGQIERALLHATQGTALYGQVVRAVTGTEAASGRRVVVQGGQIFSGGAGERQSILQTLTLPAYLQQARSQKRLTATELDLVASLEASGVPRAAAVREVQALERSGFSRRSVAKVQGRKAEQSYWNTEATAISSHLSRARRQEIQQGPEGLAGWVYHRLLHMGASPAQASKAVAPLYNVPSGRDRNALGGRATTGGRLAGVGGHDTVPVGGGYAAPGELWVNRHTEARANAMLAPHGVTLGGLTATETRPHSAPYSTGGRARYGFGGPASGAALGPMGRYALHPGITTVGNRVLDRYPGLAVTSTTGGHHARNSYHYRRMAVDLAGDQGLMHRASTWIAANLGAGLLEGIHNTGLSVDNGKNVRPGFWGPTVWQQHVNHIHLAAGDGGATGAAAGRASAGKGGGARGGRGGTGGGGIGAYSIANILGPQLNLGLGGLDFSPGISTGTAAGAGRRGRGQKGGGGPMVSTSGAAQSYAHSQLSAYGWGEPQWGPLRTLWNNESGWNPRIRNKQGSGAEGIPQFLPMPGRMIPPGFPDTPPINAAKQVDWGMRYIKGRYGTPTAALNFWNAQSPHSYSLGGRRPRWGGWHGMGLDRTFSSPTVIGVGERGAERVTVTPKGQGRRPVNFSPQLNLTVHDGDPRKTEAAVTKALNEFATHLAHLPFDGEDTA